MATDARNREWDARRDIQQASLNLLAYHEEPIEGGDPKAADLLNALEEAVVAYGRAVREADKEEVRATVIAFADSLRKPVIGGPLTLSDAISGFYRLADDAVAAIEALEKLDES